MTLETTARDASEALHAAAVGVDRPDMAAVRRSRLRRSGLGIAAATFAVTLVVLGGFSMFGPGPGADVAGPAATDPTAPAPTSAPSTTTTPPETAAPSPVTGTLAGNVFVLDDGDGPEICSAVAESLPPQCSGPPLDGLDWASAPWADSAQGVTWANMYVEVRFAEGRFELVSDPQETRELDRPTVDFTPPCEAPAGGWVFTPGPGATENDLEAAMSYIQAQPDHAAAWVYNLVDPPREFTFEYVLVAAFTGDLARHEASIAELWTGPLCVVERPYTERDLRAVQDELASLSRREPVLNGIGYPTGFSVDVTTGTVRVSALFQTTAGHRWLDQRFGEGVVVVEPLLAEIPAGDG